MLSFRRIYGDRVPLYPSEGRVEMRECTREEYQIGERKVVKIDAYQEVVIKEEALEEISLFQDYPSLRRSSRLKERVPPLADRLPVAPCKSPFSFSPQIRRAHHCIQQNLEGDLVERVEWSTFALSHIPCSLPFYVLPLQFHPPLSTSQKRHSIGLSFYLVRQAYATLAFFARFPVFREMLLGYIPVRSTQGNNSKIC